MTPGRGWWSRSTGSVHGALSEPDSLLLIGSGWEGKGPMAALQCVLATLECSALRAGRVPTNQW